MEPVLQTIDLRKTYSPGTPQATEALRGINLTFDRGRYYAIIGKSGCGKSTLLHLLGALDTPSSGEIRFGGQNILTLSRRELAIFRRRRIGFVFQSYNLLQEHTVLENILMPLHLDRRQPEPDYLRRVLSLLGLEELQHKYPSQLSGGEQQRVGIARAIITKPDVVLADEPTGNLDPRTSAATLELLKSMVQELNQALILVTHDMDVANQAEVRIRIHQGEITEITEL